MYRKISIDNINKFNDVLLNASFLGKKIKLEISKLGININIDCISVPESINECKSASFFEGSSSYDVVEHGNKKFNLYLHIWDRFGLKDRYTKTISLYCGCDDFPGGFSGSFYKIELSESLEDNENIYLVKNFSNFFNNSLSSEIEEYGCDVILHNNEHFLIISKFKKSNLNDLSKHSEIFVDFLKNYIRCAFINEGFIIECYNTK